MTAQPPTAHSTTREQMDALVDGHYRAEKDGDFEAIVDGFAPTPSTTSSDAPETHSTAATKSRASIAPCSPRFESTASNPSDAGTATTTSSTSRSCTQRRRSALRARRARTPGPSTLPAHIRLQRRPDQPRKRLDRPRRHPATALRLSRPRPAGGTSRPRRPSAAVGRAMSWTLSGPRRCRAQVDVAFASSGSRTAPRRSGRPSGRSQALRSQRRPWPFPCPRPGRRARRPSTSAATPSGRPIHEVAEGYSQAIVEPGDREKPRERAQAGASRVGCHVDGGRLTALAMAFPSFRELD